MYLQDCVAITQFILSSLLSSMSCPSPFKQRGYLCSIKGPTSASKPFPFYHSVCILAFTDRFKLEVKSLRAPSQLFLTKLLNSARCIDDIQFGSRFICYQECYTLCRNNGIIEAGIRLPWRDVVGSACIAQWLKIYHTCPCCRVVLFPPQAQPHNGAPSTGEDDAMTIPEAQRLLN